jgi:UDP-N-acetyl-D-glucosamine dehydrogenase
MENRANGYHLQTTSKSPSELAEQVIEKINRRGARIGVIGLGYAGLPLACTFAEAGFTTYGIDTDETKVERIAQGESYIRHIAGERIERLFDSRKLVPTSDFSCLVDCDAAIICVPTPLGEGRVPDLSYVLGSANAVAEHLHRGQLVVLESTTYPGTTDEVLLELFAHSGLKVGEDFFLAFSPEREDPANGSFTTRNIPKVVGGVTANCLMVANSLYRAAVEHTVPVSSARVAECTKLLENIYRCVNIAMINELKLLFQRMDIDIWEVIRAASTKPFGFTPFTPGPGMGGHCIPIDPFYLTWKAHQYGFATRFIELAGEINSAMPGHVVQRLVQGLNLQGKPLKGARILLIGVAYKRNTDDTRESPALSIINLLQRGLASVCYHDPWVARLRSRHLKGEMESLALTAASLADTDGVIIVTDHSNVDYEMIVANAKLVVDTRNALAEHHSNDCLIIPA